tara:strand:- start:18 stop:998 length:981 start_codon:yes stop_codon:yes gene_type:complete
MRVVITGGLGFIGTNLTKYLLNKRVIKQIIIIDKMTESNTSNLNSFCKFRFFSSSKQYRRSKDKVVVIKANVLNKKFSEDILTKNDIVVHLAAESGVDISISQPEESFNVNVVGAFNYLNAGRVKKVKRFIFASSGAVFGNSKPPLTEKTTKGAISPYGSSKLTIESFCETFSNVFKLRTTILRFSNCYGIFSENKNSVISKFIKNINKGHVNYINGDGTQTRDFIYVDDLVDAIFRSFSDKPDFNDYNVSTGKETSIRSLLEILKEIYLAYGKKVRVQYQKERVGDMKKNYSIPRKIKKNLNWTPKTNLLNGLRITSEWFLKNNR